MILRDVFAEALLWRRRGFSTSLLDRRANEMALELVAAVTIIAILVGLAAGNGGQQMTKSMLVEVASLSANHRVEASEYLAVRGTLPDDGGVYAPSDISGKYVSGIEWRDEEIVVTMSSLFMRSAAGANAASAESSAAATVAFRLAVHPETGRRVFLCGNTAPPPGYTAAPPQHTTLSDEYLPFFCRV